jgi:hypothetical protein
VLQHRRTKKNTQKSRCTDRCVRYGTIVPYGVAIISTIDIKSKTNGSQTPAIIEKRYSKDLPFYESENVRFPSITSDGFRVKVGLNKSIKIWIESKHTKSQWQNEFTDFNDISGPPPMPNEAIASFLKVSLIFY